MLGQSHKIGPIRPPIVYSNPHGVKVGAIRWDGVYQNGTVETQEVGYLSPNQYHFRAPWWSTAGSNTIAFAGSQATLDAEIDYAAAAGIYWAFFRYAVGDAMNTAWNFFQASSKRATMPYCLFWGAYGYFSTEVGNNLANIITFLSQPNYVTVLGGRPLIYIYNDGNGTSAAAAVATLRSACLTAGLLNPYIVGCNGNPISGAVAIKTANNLDAISFYAIQFNDTSTYDLLCSKVADYWKQTLAASEMIPTAMTGWNPAPRGQPGNTDYAIAAQLSAHAQAAIDFSAANCPSKAVLAYAWNEHSEGGYICPLYVDGTAADHSRLDAFAAPLQ